ncbi:MAG: hypothetical protein MUC97_00315 [Bernardetiaceae bacterium]|jgi:MFS family permease|nr:hypothetical protein [Bernardetiaceae bacterium]
MLYLSFGMASVLLSSLGLVMLQSFKYDVASSDAGLLLVLTNVGSGLGGLSLTGFIARWGHQKSLMAALGLMLLGCCFMPVALNFWVPSAFFLLIGFAFTVVKAVAYSYAWAFCRSQAAHVSFLNRLEALFFIGSILTIVVAGGLTSQWGVEVHHNFGLFALGVAAVMWYLHRHPLPALATLPTASLRSGPLALVHLLSYSLVWLALTALLTIEFIEGHLTGWQTIFLEQHYLVSDGLATQAGLAGMLALAVGRLVASYLAYLTSPAILLIISIFAAMSGVVIIGIAELAQPHLEPTTLAEWLQMPNVIWLYYFTLFVQGPILPTLCSVVLWHTPRPGQAAMAGLMALVSVAGFWTSQRLSSALLEGFAPTVSIVFTALPLTLLAIIGFLLTSDLRRSASETSGSTAPPSS